MNLDAIMANANRVTSPFGAVVDGRKTGLAGCSQSGDCPRAAYCLRADSALSMRATMRTTEHCTMFISNKEAA